MQEKASSSSSSLDRSSSKEWDISKAVKVLYPSRQTAYNNQSDMNGTIHTAESRFNPLLLEFGEIELQDWAVTASSSCIQGNMDRSKSSKGKNTKTLFSSRDVNYDSETSSAAATIVNAASSSSMKNIQGRLRLCSKSIIFEPQDTSRAIIRCPLEKLVSLPIPTSSQVNTHHHSLEDTQTNTGDSGAAPTCILISFNKYYLMKADHVVSPFISMDIPTEFRFLFLYSKPTTFLHLIQTLDPMNLSTPWEQVTTSNLACFMVDPLILTPGCCVVTLQHLYFQPWKGNWDSVLGSSNSTTTTTTYSSSHYTMVHADSSNSSSSSPSSNTKPCSSKAFKWTLSSMIATARRYHGLRDVGIEVFFQSGPSVLLAFTSYTDRESVFKLLSHLPCHSDETFIAQSLQAWLDGTIDNFEYLLILNSASGRSFHDLSRYPIFPWVLADYVSPKLDVSTLFTPFTKSKRGEYPSPEYNRVFRDLQKPVGALNEQRLEYFQTRYKNMHDMEQAFLYGTHYSAPGYILYYLVRTMPEHMLCLQNGKFDAPDRLFYSLDHCFSSLLTNPADVKECIPQFFDTSGNMDFLYNVRNLPLGVTQNGIRVNDVLLPPWAKSPKDFVSKNRLALESDYCTRKLHQWIDLIFGVRSRGDRAIESMNLFHPTAYVGPKDLEKLKTEEEKKHAELHATEFGIVPDQLFSKPHPHRHMDLLREQGFQVHSFISDLTNRFSKVKEEGEESKEHWEVLKKPKSTNIPSSKRDETRRNNKTKDDSDMENSSQEKTVTTFNEPSIETSSARDSSKPYQQGSTTKLSLSGFADVFSRGGTSNTRKFPQLKDIRGGFRDGPITSTAPVSPVLTLGMDVTNQVTVTPLSAEQYPVVDWEMKQVLPAKKIHTDAVSGCILTLDGGVDATLLTTTSLDGSMIVHTIQSFTAMPSFHEQGPTEQERRKFTSRIPYLGSSVASRSIMNSNSKMMDNTSNSSSPSLQLHLYRSHSSTDPLSTLAVVGDRNGGHIAFVGGHDDVVMAYGIQSGCLLASLHSHRDAVTGVSVIICPSFYKNTYNFNSTHIMVTGSWDSTIKLWSVSIMSGESVTIDRRVPIVELCDADTSIVSVAAAIDHEGSAVLIAAGCSDGSFLVWSWNSTEGKKLIHKQEIRRGSGPCTCAIWRTQQVPSSSSSSTVEEQEDFLCVGLGNGRVMSYVVRNGMISTLSKLNIGSSVHCLSFAGDDMLVAGCADGGIRLIQVGRDGHFDFHPRLWKSIHGKNSPRITSISVVKSPVSTIECKTFWCGIGAEDGIVSVHELKELPSMPQLSD